MERLRVTEVLKKNKIIMAQNELSDTMSSTPVAPVTTLGAYSQAMAEQYGPNWMYFKRSEDYDMWRTRLENQYNADLADYQNYLQTMKYRKSDLEAAGYNANYMDHQGISPASPGSYTTHDQTDSFAPIMRFLNIAGQATGISSQSIGSIMGVLTGLSQIDKNNMDRHSKTLANQVTSLGLWRLAGQLFGSDNISDVMTWLSGGNVKVDYSKYPDGPIGYLASLFKNGPLMKGLQLNLGLSGEKMKNIAEGTKKIAAEIPGITSKSEISSKESDLYTGNKILMWLTALARAVSSFM